ncbi:MAG: radical SAM protein [bacterium]|nr:radical SAM protein [bacterium]
MSSPVWLPEIVYVSESAREDSMTSRVLTRLPEVDVRYIPDGSDPLAEKTAGTDFSRDSERFSAGKRRLMLTRYQGSWMRACPGTSQHVCCNLWTINPGEGCPFDCSYCYLQSYLLRNPTLKLYVNTADMMNEVEQRISSDRSRLFRITTGEVVDSLVWDNLTDSSYDLVPFFARQDNAILELKTKSNHIDNLLRLKNEHRGHTVISWSVNAESICRTDEVHTASLDERIEAASQVVEAGYRVGFHFDPVVHFPGWEDEYSASVRKIFDRIAVGNVAWVSVASLRYAPQMQEIMRERFPHSDLPYGEQFLAKDNKLRYIQPLRFKVIDFVWKQLKSVSPAMPVYMCMESPAAWRNIAGGPPVAGSELQEVFSRAGRLPVIGQDSI